MIVPCFNGKFVAANSELGKGNSVFVHSYPGEVLLLLATPSKPITRVSAEVSASVRVHADTL